MSTSCSTCSSVKTSVLVGDLPGLPLVGRRIGTIHDHVHLPGDRPLAAPLLLEPREARSVREQAGDDVGQLVAVDVVGEHVGAADEGIRAAPERHRVELPRPAGRAGGRLFPPAAALNDVGLAVAVDVAVAIAVPAPVALVGDRVERPALRRICARLRDADHAGRRRCRSTSAARACRRHRCRRAASFPTTRRSVTWCIGQWRDSPFGLT